MQMLETVEQETGASPEWAVIWLHGLGADGHDFAPIVPELVRAPWPAVRFVFPHAPKRPVSINNGMPMRAWYDIVSMDFRSRADAKGVAESVQQVEELIAREQARGIPSQRIVLAGFSQGGAITLSAGLQRREPLAGLVALSSYLPEVDAAATQLVAGATAQPIFMAHGNADPVIPVQIAEHSAQVLGELGFNLQWQRYPMAHQVCGEEIHALGDWLQARFQQA